MTKSVTFSTKPYTIGLWSTFLILSVITDTQRIVYDRQSRILEKLIVTAREPTIKTVLETNMTTTNEATTITTFHDNDVIFGRGPHLRQLLGNIFFRQQIEKHSNEYNKSDDLADKECACYRVIRAIEDHGGRFLESKTEKDSKSKGKTEKRSLEQGLITQADTWSEAGIRKVLRKIKQAFRDHTNSHKRKLKATGRYPASSMAKKIVLKTGNSLSRGSSQPNFSHLVLSKEPVDRRASNDFKTLVRCLDWLDELKEKNQMLALEIERIALENERRYAAPTHVCSSSGARPECTYS